MCRAFRLSAERVRVYRVEALKLADTIARLTGSRALADSATSNLLAAVESVRDAVRRVCRIPFTDQVRLPVGRAAALAADLRPYSDA
jgi:hypothetical protein